MLLLNYVRTRLNVREMQVLTRAVFTAVLIHAKKKKKKKKKRKKKKKKKKKKRKKKKRVSLFTSV